MSAFFQRIAWKERIQLHKSTCFRTQNKYCVLKETSLLNKAYLFINSSSFKGWEIRVEHCHKIINQNRLHRDTILAFRRLKIGCFRLFLVVFDLKKRCCRRTVFLEQHQCFEPQPRAGECSRLQQVEKVH